jgi:hypothetical protein
MELVHVVTQRLTRCRFIGTNTQDGHALEHQSLLGPLFGISAIPESGEAALYRPSSLLAGCMLIYFPPQMNACIVYLHACILHSKPQSTLSPLHVPSWCLCLLRPCGLLSPLPSTVSSRHPLAVALRQPSVLQQCFLDPDGRSRGDMRNAITSVQLALDNLHVQLHRLVMVFLKSQVRGSME